jgi:hypothetical protein
MTGAERFWYVVLCIYFGAGYLAKVCHKKALHESGLAERTDAEKFWYFLLCLWLGAGYFAKVPMKKALSNIGLSQMTDASQFWYIIFCLYLALCLGCCPQPQCSPGVAAPDACRIRFELAKSGSCRSGLRTT